MRLTQGVGAFGRTVPDEICDDLAGLAAERDPHPAGVRFGTDEAPKLVEFEHVARLGRQERRRSVAGRLSAFFRASLRDRVPRATPKTRWAARRLKRSVATARSTSFLRSGAVSRLLGCNTRLRPRTPGSGTVGGRRRSCRF